MADLVLASGSPRRHELLRMVGIEHAVDSPGIDESVEPGEAPGAYAARMARVKALTVASRHPGACVLGADTVVTVDGDVVGKPTDPLEAEAMLERLAGRRHDVLTAVALVRDGMVQEERVSVTTVWMQPFDSGLVHAYVTTGEPMDKAGAYAAQGLGALLIDRVQGDLFTVMGLPLLEVVDMLEVCRLGRIGGRR
jgi:septum formation protein